MHVSRTAQILWLGRYAASKKVLAFVNIIKVVKVADFVNIITGGKVKNVWIGIVPKGRAIVIRLRSAPRIIGIGNGRRGQVIGVRAQ